MCAVRNRDNFRQAAVTTLAMRASYICSNPGCRSLTLAPSTTDPEKIISVGIAAHITAAAPHGPRFDPSLGPIQRASIENGIFLCPACAAIIDKNGGRDFPVKLLREWKREHEDWVRNNLNKSVHSLVRIKAPSLEVCFDDMSTHDEVQKKRAAKKNKNIKAELSDRIIRLDLQIFNRGDAPAIDIHVFMDLVGPFQICTIKELRQMWDIYPHSLIKDPKKFFDQLTRNESLTAEQRLAGMAADVFAFMIFEDLVAPSRVKPKHVAARDVQPSIDGTRVTFRIKKLKQNLPQTFESLYIVFHSWKNVASFNIPFRVNAEELVTDVEGILDVHIRKGRVSDRK